MIPEYLSEASLQRFIATALNEDIPSEDHSTLGSVSEHHISTGQLLVKSDGVIAGMELAAKIFDQVDSRLEFFPLVNDGAEVKTNDITFKVTGATRSILKSERLVLNCMQRMSGIATRTRSLNKIISGTKARLMDTRKTTPNFRAMEKWAVRIGGGLNHRFSLSDMVMLKDNHIDAAGGICAAVTAIRSYLQSARLALRIEVETRNLTEVGEALEAGVDVIMLDNMSVAMMREAVQLIAERSKVEASGGITEHNLREVAETGVDFISLGLLTHSVKSLDLSLKLIKRT
jgi:nicotinate-nucleotide pyrophosphorylase (carboxylating)